jgi:hypothetical protein
MVMMPPYGGAVCGLRLGSRNVKTQCWGSEIHIDARWELSGKKWSMSARRRCTL